MEDLKFNRGLHKLQLLLRRDMSLRTSFAFVIASFMPKTIMQTMYIQGAHIWIHKSLFPFVAKTHTQALPSTLKV